MSLFEELKRRNVFRVAALYVGIAWVIIEASSVILPELNAPHWIFRGMIFVAIAGFPVAVVLAWVYEITDRGIRRDTSVPDAERVKRSRQKDFVIIGVLVIALGVSVYLNITSRIQPGPVATLSLLVADFDNRTDDSMFSGALEQALTIGLEGAPFVTAYPRNQALQSAAKLGNADRQGIDADLAKLIGVREGIGAVLTGVIETAGSGYRLEARVIDPHTDATLAKAASRAQSKLDVLTAVGDVAEGLRDDLGDVTVGEKDELVTVTSLEAAKEYATAQNLHLDGRDDQAVMYYQRAVELDPDFGRAYSGWALAAFRLGRSEESDRLWKKALTLLDRMTERERHRTLGLYYLLVSKNYQKAVENYATLVERFPADSGGHNNLAVAHFYLRQFDEALRRGRRTLEIYPGRAIYRTNYALYAMYASQFELAATEARAVAETEGGYHKAYLPLAMAAIDELALDEARAAYERMRAAGARGASLAVTGLADLAAFEGRFGAARDILLAGIEADRDAGNTRAIGSKLVALAEVQAALGDDSAASATIDEALNGAPDEAIHVAAARLLLDLGDVDTAAGIASKLAAGVQPQSRAYGQMIAALMARNSGDLPGALDALRASIEFSDSWLARFELGVTYLEAELGAEALSEFQLCQQRRGEATAVFLDDIPTIRYAASLPYWLGRSAESLGMTGDAERHYQRLLSYRATEYDRLAGDARQRLAPKGGD